VELAVNGSLVRYSLIRGRCVRHVEDIRAGGTLTRFLSEFVQKARRINLGDGMNYQTQMGPLISDAQRKKVIAYVEKAKIEGATVACGGVIPPTRLEERLFLRAHGTDRRGA
jgi:aldehyde dehydrogenase (NAD+)